MCVPDEVALAEARRMSFCLRQRRRSGGVGLWNSHVYESHLEIACGVGAVPCELV